MRVSKKTNPEIEKIESKLKQLRVRKSELLKELVELNLL